METIFDHNPTKEELEYITSCETKEKYCDFLSEQTAYHDLATLFRLRNNTKEYIRYSDLSNNAMVFYGECL